MNKKGFTLIELLAVIVILAVVLTISTTVIVSIIDDAKMKAFSITASNIVSSVELYFSKNYDIKLGKTFVIRDGKLTSGDLLINGDLPDTAEIIVDEDGNIKVRAIGDGYCAYKDFLDAEITTTKDVSLCYTTEECFVFESDTGTITWYYDHVNNDINKPNCPKYVFIPPTIGGVTVKNIKEWSFNSRDLISVTISEGVETIGNAAFKESNIKYISLPNTLTSIGWSSFYGNSISFVIIPENVTSIQNDSFRANSLETVEIYMHNIPGSLFSSGYNMENLIIGDTVKTISDGAFNGCDINTLTIENGVESIGSWTFGNNDIANVDIPTSVVSISDGAFSSNPISSVIIRGNSLNPSNRFDSILSNIGFWGLAVTYINE